MRRIILAAIIVLGLALVFLTVAKHSSHHLLLKTYFQDAHGLRAGAPVRVAGVDVGRVTEVRVRPELKEHAAEVRMSLQTPYELKIPEDPADLFLAGSAKAFKLILVTADRNLIRTKGVSVMEN